MSLFPVPVDNSDGIYSLAEIIEAHWPEILKMWKAEAKLDHDFNKATNYFQRLDAIEKYYKSLHDEIMMEHKRCPIRFYTSYPIDWSRIFSPIESLAWDAIRCKGYVVLYPQYPALNYHLDFANPGYKIALELDGKNFHKRDRDFIRDLELKQNGWTVYRITGAEMNAKDYKDWYDVEGLDQDEQIHHIKDWILNTGDGVIEAIKQVHFDKISLYNSDDEDYDPVWAAFYHACKQTLNNHRS
jgi:hypothetical protein